MKKKTIWYCTGCKEKCAVKITGEYRINRHSNPYENCILFSDWHCSEQGYKPHWHKHEPQKRETEVKAPF